MSAKNKQSQANKGKELIREVAGKKYQRIPVATKVVGPKDDLEKVVSEAVVGKLEAGDIVFITEKIVGITQGRAFLVETIKPRKLAYFLSDRVTKTPVGIGLGMPETMEMALRECGVPRILLAAGVAAVTKKLGRKGDFYRVAGAKARGIDGPTAHTLSPYNQCVVLGPAEPEKVARKLAGKIGVEVVIVDINDLGGNVLGCSSKKLNRKEIAEILRDNPLGQERQQTPIGIIREV